ncbi:MAG: hypothetical protein WKF96_19035 [Solirubrobacteraceae bacterium]
MTGPPLQDRELIGYLGTFQELQMHLDERPRLTIVQAAPRSGASGLLAHVATTLDGLIVLVDARDCHDVTDLAMSIGDHAVAAARPQASSWWTSSRPVGGREALELARTLARRGSDLDDLRQGHGPPSALLADAFALVKALTQDAGATVVIDHLGELLAGLKARDAAQLLSDLRARAQEIGGASLVLVDAWDGQIVGDLHDPHAALYRGGVLLDIRRASAEEFVTDLAIGRPWLPSEITPPLLRGLADLAAGAPGPLWAMVDLIHSGAVTFGDVDRQRLEAAPLPAFAATAFRRLCDLNRGALAAQWSMLRRVHPQANAVIAALAVGYGPHAIPANPKVARDALRRLRGLGIVWQPKPRTWAIADPMLAAFARSHRPPWLTRRTAGATSAADAAAAMTGGAL